MASLYLARFGNLTFDEYDGDIIDGFAFYFDNTERQEEFRRMTGEARAQLGYPYNPGAPGEEMWLNISAYKPSAHVTVMIALGDEGDKGDWGSHDFEVELTTDEAQTLIGFVMDHFHRKMLVGWGCKRLSDGAA